MVPDRYCVSHMAKEFGLTVTEEMILADLLEGWTTEEIIKKTNVSPSTFATHLSRIRNKVGCNATMEVVLMALKRANHIKAISSRND